MNLHLNQKESVLGFKINTKNKKKSTAYKLVKRRNLIINYKNKIKYTVLRIK